MQIEDRREFLVKSMGLGVGALAASQIGALISSASAAEKSTSAETTPANAPYAKLAQVAADCLRTGYACINHCQKELAAGKTNMARCNATTHEMVAISQAMLSLASYDSPRAMKLVPVFLDACKACADSCEEHKAHWSMGMHLECKACYEACVAAEKVCTSLNS
jgi:Cys-rich four helix bundle protein (predicted Tat secretion target)